MSSEASYALQQEMYALYRKYYHSGQVILCDQDDFANGTLRIREPGLYVLTEDIIFNPADGMNTTCDASGSAPESQLNKGDYTDKAYNMGFFAAITVEAKGVIIDLQGHTIRQSYSHYFRQRFFNVIELATSPFVPGQGPGAVRSSNGDSPFKAASQCLILNGTIGLSSHGSIHGNNNEKVMLQNLVVRDFETTGIQLNGVKTAFMDGLQVTGIAYAPLAAQTFSLVRHSIELDKSNLPDISSSPFRPPSCTTGWDATTLQTQLQTVITLLHAPFLSADAAVCNGATTSVDTTLSTIWIQLCEKVDSYLHNSDSIPVDPKRFVNQYPSDATDMEATAHAIIDAPLTCESNRPFPDGSAMVGIMCNCTGVSVNELRDVCPANGNGCCAANGAQQYQTDAAARRHSECVTLNNITVDRLQLHAKESLGFKYDGKTFIRDTTAAVLDARTLIQGDGFEKACVYVSIVKAQQKSTSQNTVYPWGVPTESQALSIGDFLTSNTTTTYDYSDLHTHFPNAQWVYNIDIMAHVSKGIFGLRMENVKGLSIEGVCVKNLLNTSKVIPARNLPRGDPMDANVRLTSTTQGVSLVSAITNPLDQTSALAYAGADIRGIFVGQCQGTLVTKTNVSNSEACAGLVRALEFDESVRCGAHTFTVKSLKGLYPSVIHIHSNCSLVHLREIKCEDTPTNAFYTYITNIINTVETADNNDNDPEGKKAAQILLRSLLRMYASDPSMIHQELPGCVRDLRL